MSTIPRQDRCADFVSLRYIIRGSLPWQGLQIRDQRQGHELVVGKKRTDSTEELYRDLPEHFGIYFDRVRSLGFDEIPAYTYLSRVFRELFVREGFDRDHVADWTNLKYLMGTYTVIPARSR